MISKIVCKHTILFFSDFFGIGFGLKKNLFTFAVPKDTWEVPKYLIYYGEIAQLVEHRTENPCVGGSSPPFTTKNPLYVAYEGFLFEWVSKWVSEKYFRFH